MWFIQVQHSLVLPPYQRRVEPLRTPAAAQQPRHEVSGRMRMFSHVLPGRYCMLLWDHPNLDYPGVEATHHGVNAVHPLGLADSPQQKTLNQLHPWQLRMPALHILKRVRYSYASGAGINATQKSSFFLVS